MLRAVAASCARLNLNVLLLLSRRIIAAGFAYFLPSAAVEQQNPTWVSTNRLFQNHPKLYSLEHCKSLCQLQPILSYTIVSGLFNNPFVSSRILHACFNTISPPCIGYASLVFAQMEKPNIFSWNTMIRGLAGSDEQKDVLGAFEVYGEMLVRGVLPDKHTFPFLLKACQSASDIEMGRLVHAHSLVLGFNSDPFLQTELMNVYFDRGCLEYACCVFDRMTQKDVVSWTGMISGLVGAGCYEEALVVFNEMRHGGSSPRPNVATMVSATSACANLGSLDHARALHGYAEKVGLVADVFVCNSLIDVYAKCGSADQALELFQRMGRRDLHSWTAMIMGLAVHGFGDEALSVFSSMKIASLSPDSITFIAVLSACSHAGMVEEGRRQFVSMVRDYNIVPETKHYGCMVDLLSRAGLLYDAYEFVLAMPQQPNLEILGSLLSACRLHNNLQLGEEISKEIRSVCQYEGGANVLLSNIYANENQWSDVIHVRKEMRWKGTKHYGRSWIEVNGVVHEFVAGDKFHGHAEEICFILDGLRRISIFQIE